MADLKVLVLVKQTFNTEARIQLSAAGDVDDKGIKFICNPYDEFAIEEAVRMKERGDAAHVRLLTVGSDKAADSLRQGLAMGADDAARVWDDALANADNATIAKVLAAAIKKYEWDILLCGKVAVDDQSSEVPGRLSVLLETPVINAAAKIEIAGDSVKITRDTDAGTETLLSKLPAFITTEKGLNEPRYPPLPKIMKAKRKAIDELTPADLGVELAKSVEIVGHELPPAKSGAKMIKGAPAEQAAELVRLLREEAKVL
ncbi:MAG: electron transfer flavoprotein subunit beta/FixA family protein [Phycisphaerae bacterium]|nr:electron transfer flavoprotein subunit beta/FixA family protein [Phycisphaerae bacterium]